MQIQQVLSMVINVTHGMWMLLSMVLIFKTDTGMYTYCVCVWVDCLEILQNFYFLSNFLHWKNK